MRKHLLQWMLLLVAFAVPWTTNAQTLVVADGSENNQYVPFDGYNADAAQHNQMIYPADVLTDMVGKSITQMVFFIDGSASNGTNTSASRLGTWTVSLGETENTTLSGLDNSTSLTQVYQGYFDCSSGTLTLAFDDGYVYNGGNLLVDLNHASASWNKWYFLGISSTGSSYTYGSQRNFLPKVEFTFMAPPSCLKPTGLAVVPDVTTAAFSWTASVTAVESYEWLYTASGVDPDWTEANNTTETSVEIARLTANTPYVAYVRANCGGGDYSDAVSFNFRTACVAVTTFPWSENFESYDASSSGVVFDAPCWVNEHISGSGTKTYQVYSGTNGTNSTKQLCLPDMSNGTMTKLVLPQMTLAAEDSYVFSIDVYRNATGTSYTTEGVRVYASTDGEIEGATELGFLYRNCTQTDGNVVPAESASGWYTYEFEIPFTGTCYIVLRGESKYGSATYLDNFKVAKVLPCVKPVAPEFVSSTTTTATLSWTNGGTETAWQIAYSTDANFDPADVTPVDVTSNPGTITGLTASTTYYAYVRANCDANGYSDWSTAKCQFTTACAAIMEYPYTENFDNYSVASNYTAPSAQVLPVCWSGINTTTYSSYMVFPTIFYYSYTNYANSTPNCLKLYTSYSSYSDYDPQDQYAILPEMEGLAGKQITLFARGYNDNSTFKIGLMADPTDATTFEPITEQELTTSYQEFVYDIPSDATAHYVAIMIEAANSSRSSNGVYIDDISIEVPPTCIKPKDLAKTAVTAHTATLGWTNGADETAWQIVYATDANFDPNDEALRPVDVTSNPATIEGLDASTTYYAYVRANCGAENGVSAWCRSKVSFTTTTATAVPIGLAYDAATLTSREVTVNWTGATTNDLHESFDLYYSTESTAPTADTMPSVTGLTAATYHFTGLVGETQYYVWVRDNCGADGYSNWTSSITFTTASDCQTPDGLAAGELTANTASITWNTYGQREFNLRYSSDGERWMDAENPSTPFTLTGLTGNTAYQVQVQATCNTEEWSTVLSFTTLCDAVTAFPWSETFDGLTVANSIPDCWDNADGTTANASYKWCYNTKTSGNGSAIGHTNADKCVVFNSYNNSSALTNFLKTPTMSLPAGKEMQLRFWYKNPAGGDFSVYISTDGGATYTTELATDLTGVSAWTESTPISLADYAGQNVVIVFKGTSNWGNGDAYLYLDDVTIEKVPTCFMPTAAAAEDITVEGATLTWTRDTRNAEGETYTVKQVTAEGNVTVEENINGTDFVLTGLNDNTEYTYMILTNCVADDETVEAVTVTFTTLANCPAPTEVAVDNITAHKANVAWTGYEANDSYVVSYRESAYFDGIVTEFGSSIPTGWAQYNGLLSNVMNGTALTSSSYGWSFGSNNGVFDDHARVNIYGASCNKWLVTSSVTIPEDGALDFDLALTDFSGTLVAPQTTGTDDKFVVLISTDDAATWTVLRQWDNSESEYVYNNINSTATGENVTIDLSAYAGQSAKIAFYAESTSNNADNNLHIDNVSIGKMVSAGDWKTVETAENNATLTDLEAETLYEVKVNGVCDNTPEEFGSSIVSFATAVACVAPTALVADDVTTNSATLSWTPGAEETDWQICINGDEENLIDVAVDGDPSYILGNLASATTFTAKVRANCGLEDGTSEWSDEVTFTTGCDVYAIPYYNDFESEADLYCMTMVDEASNTGISTSKPYHGSSSFRFRYNSNPPQYLISPELTGTEAGVQVEFSYAAHSSNNPESFQVGYSTTTNEPAVFTWGTEMTNLTSTFYQRYYEIIPTANVKYVAIRYTANDKYYLYIDSLVIRDIETFDVTVNVTPEAAGDVASEPSVLTGLHHNDLVTLTASASEGYYFNGWNEDDRVVENNPLSFRVHESRNITANFDTNVYNVTVNVNNDGGSVEGPTTVKHFAGGTYVAMAAPCYHFVNWTNTNGDEIGTDATLNMLAVSDTAIVANFESDSYVTDTVATVCNEFTWHGISYTETPAEAPTYTYTSVSGCDSVVVLYLTVNHSRISHEYVTNCGPYTWEVNGKTYNKSGVKTNKSVTPEGCLSYDTLTLVVVDKYSNNIAITACGPYTWEVNGKTYNTSGVKTYKGTAEDGCPVYDTLVLTINDLGGNYESVTNCGSYEWEADGKTYNTSGEKVYTYTDENNCFHRDTLNLTIVSKWSNNESVTACGPYIWDKNGATYSKSGVKYFKGTAADGCPEYDTLNLVIIPAAGTTVAATACGSYTWDVDGKTYNKSGVKTSTTTGLDGCYHTDTLVLNIIDKYTSNVTVEACGPYEWEKSGTTYSKSGVKYFKGQAGDGCPTYDTLNLVITPAGGTYTQVTNCGSYTWSVDGKTYNKSGVKTFTYIDPAGCYQIDTLDLNVIKGYGNTTVQEACGPYTWAVDGKTYGKGGVKTYKTPEPDENGCYTYDTLILTITPAGGTYTLVTNCGPYTWAVDGKTYNISGVKTYTSTDVAGCYQVDTLDLSVIKGYTSTTEYEACGPYTWAVNGQTYGKGGVKTYKSPEPDENGCYSYDTLILTITPVGGTYQEVTMCAPYTWSVDGKAYNKSGVKTYTYTDENNCYHVDTLNLTIVKYSNHAYVTSCGSYTWEVNGKTYNKGGDKYYKSYRTEDGCPMYDTLTLVIENCETNSPAESFGLGESVAPQLSIYPNPTTGRLQIEAAQVNKVEVLDLVGRCVAVFEETNTLDISSLAAGTYTLRVTMPEGVELRKVVKR